MVKRFLILSSSFEYNENGPNFNLAHARCEWLGYTSADCHGCLERGARKLTGENLKVVWAEFSTLS